MRRLASALLILATLQGCASNIPHAYENEDLSSLQLFGANGQPRFTAELACSAASIQETRQCSTVANAFYAWANLRHFRLHMANADDPSLRDEKPVAGGAKPDQPYRLTINFQPFFHASLLAGTGGNYVPGEVGYKATVRIFGASSASAVRKLFLHERKPVPEQANVTEFIRGDVAAVIAKIDPGYSP